MWAIIISPDGFRLVTVVHKKHGYIFNLKAIKEPVL